MTGGDGGEGSDAEISALKWIELTSVTPNIGTIDVKYMSNVVFPSVTVISSVFSPTILSSTYTSSLCNDTFDTFRCSRHRNPYYI